MRYQYLVLVGGLLLLAGYPHDAPGEGTFLSLEYHEKGRLPVSPHVITAKAKPTPDMITESQGVSLSFMILDKRTLLVERMHVVAGGRGDAPWSGWLQPVAFVPDLVIRDGFAVHGPEGHVNPAVWVEFTDQDGKIIYAGWMFSRDGAQTAWDHPRYDLTFLGMDEIPVATR